MRSQVRVPSALLSRSQNARPLEQQKADSTSTSVRHFNTSRALKSVNDSSTIDLTFLPEFEANSEVSSNSLLMRVPILPDTFSPARTSAHALEPEAVRIQHIHKLTTKFLKLTSPRP
jgi:hypothetical protein